MAKTRSARADLRTEVADLRAAVDQLSQHVHVLMLAIDQLTQEVQWRNHQLRDADRPPRPPFVLHSLPRDPTTPDWKVNQARPPELHRKSSRCVPPDRPCSIESPS